ncbi:MAG TPA: glycosyltransferase family 9 protein [Mucilaginibacter sp.]
MAASKHILVLRFSSMGDVAMTVPVIKALLSQNPNVSITFVSRPGFMEFFSGIDRLTYFAVDLSANYKGFRGIIRLFAQLNKSGVYHAVADLHDNLRSKLLRNMFRLSGRSYAYIDKGRDEKKQLTRFPNKVLKPLKRTIERYADVFRKLGFSIDLNYQLAKTPGPLTDQITAVVGEKTQSWIGITPFAQYKGKTFPVEKMEEVISLLGAHHVKVLLFGGTPMDEEICRQWQDKYEHVISTVRKLTMAQELILINQLDVMLSMDSAGMHLASLKGTPVVSIWGATHHYAGFLGYGQSEDNIVADSIACRPCSVYGNKPCFRKDYACLYNINPQTVVNSLLKFVQ